MIVKYFALLATVAAMAGARPAEAQQSASFEGKYYEPAGDWRFSRTPESCGAFRLFVRGDRVLRMSLTRHHPGGPVDLVLVGDAIDWRYGDIETGALPGGVAVTPSRVSRAQWREMEGVGFIANFPPLTDEGDFEGKTGREWLAGVTHLYVAEASDEPVALATGSLIKPVKWIDECMAQRLERLGIDVSGERGLSRAARPIDMETWQKRLQRRFPFDALARNYEGPVPMRLVVAEDGAVTHCQALHRLTAALLRDAACELIVEFGRFEPALDGRGEPMVSYTFFTMVFDIKGMYEPDDDSRIYGDAAGRTIRKKGDY